MSAIIGLQPLVPASGTPGETAEAAAITRQLEGCPNRGCASYIVGWGT